MQAAGHLEDLHFARAGPSELALGAGQLFRRGRRALCDRGVEAITGDVTEANPLGDGAARGGEQGLQRNAPGTGAMQKAPDGDRVLRRRSILASAQRDAWAE